MPGMTDFDAQVYYLSYKALLEEVDTPTNEKTKDLPLADLQVDVRCFAIFLCLQLFAQ